jgi:hypothetical protein
MSSDADDEAIICGGEMNTTASPAIDEHHSVQQHRWRSRI